LLVPLDPEVNLGDYRALRVEPDSVEVSEEEVESQINSYVEQHAGWRDVTRPSQYGDRMNIDVRSVLVPAEEETPSEETVVLD
ncbi:MAG TPA: trigger factor, partial [Caldilineaceae bacterium]|nr:trigger factor [Caldilineaceae bacterium]